MSTKIHSPTMLHFHSTGNLAPSQAETYLYFCDLDDVVLICMCLVTEPLVLRDCVLILQPFGYHAGDALENHHYFHFIFGESQIIFISFSCLQSQGKRGKVQSHVLLYSQPGHLVGTRSILCQKFLFCVWQEPLILI